MTEYFKIFCLYGSLILLTGLIAYIFIISPSMNPYQKYLESIENSNVVMDFACLSYPNDMGSGFYDCPDNLKFSNITGVYCNGTLLCQNSYRVNEGNKK